jgi:hypothetical protein
VSVDPLRAPLRIEPTPAVRRVREHEDERQRDRQEQSDEPGAQGEDEAPPDDGLPHVDVRA